MLIVNGENSAGGKGITAKIVQELLKLGVDVITGGNHSLHQKGSEDIHNDELRLLRPANYPPGTPGHGMTIYNSAAGFPVAVINFCGRAFMAHFDDPFRTADDLVSEALETTPIVFVDFHAETTSEKVAMGWYLDGRASAVVGTHTHIQTADEAILPNGTAYITDAGMTGPYHSVIGANKEAVLGALTTLRPRRFDCAEPVDVRVCGLYVEVDPMNGRATKVERVRVNVGDG